MVHGFIDHLDKQDRRFVLERRAGITIDVIEQLPDVVALRRDRLGVGTHLLSGEIS